MSEDQRYRAIVETIARRYGPVIDLNRSPMVMIEILRQFGDVLDENGGGGGGGGGGVSSIAVGITPPTSGEQVQLSDVMRAVLQLQREVGAIAARLDRLSPGG